MTNMEQVKERIERMRKAYPENNGLCDLLDFVNTLVPQESHELARVEGLVKELRGALKSEQWYDGVTHKIDGILSRYLSDTIKGE